MTWKCSTYIVCAYILYSFSLMVVCMNLMYSKDMEVYIYKKTCLRCIKCTQFLYSKIGQPYLTEIQALNPHIILNYFIGVRARVCVCVLHREEPIAWGVEVFSGQGSREARTSFHLSDQPQVDHVIFSSGECRVPSKLTGLTPLLNSLCLMKYKYLKDVFLL